MRLSFGQELRMAQKQVLAPRMIQSMEILQLPIMECRLGSIEILENPILEQQEDDLDLPEEGRPRAAKKKTPTHHRRRAQLVVDETKNNEDDFEHLVAMDEDFPDTFEERSRLRAAG